MSVPRIGAPQASPPAPRPSGVRGQGAVLHHALPGGGQLGGLFIVSGAGLRSHQGGAPFAGCIRLKVRLPPPVQRYTAQYIDSDSGSSVRMAHTATP